MIIRLDQGLLVYRRPSDGEASLAAYFDFRDWWVGYYRGPHHHYVCPLPCLVVRWQHRGKTGALPQVR